MSYIDRHLLPGEVVTFRTRLHWKIMVWPCLFSVLMVVAIVFAMTRQPQQPIIAAVAGALALLYLFVAWIKRRSSEFAVTTKRVIIKMGVTTTRSMELLLPKIEGITVTQTFAGRIFGYGEIVVTGSGGTHEPFDNIQAPLAFRQAVQAVADGSGPAYSQQG